MSLNETSEIAKKLKEALKMTPESNLKDLETILILEGDLRTILAEMKGDKDISQHEFEVLPGLSERLSMATCGSFGMRSEPTSTMKEQLRIVEDAIPELETKLKRIINSIEKIEMQAIKSGSPYIRGGLNRIF